jgi:hypothetical protein
MSDVVSPPPTVDNAEKGTAATPISVLPRQRALTAAALLRFLLTRLALVTVSLRETRAEQYPVTTLVPNHAIDKGQAEFLFTTEREDSAHTDEKVKQLLTLSSSLAAVILVFARDVRPRWIIVLLLALLVVTVFMCVGVFGVRTVNLPTVEDAAKDDNDGTWAKDVIRSYAENEARHAFRVDRYRAAVRYFLLALVLTPVAAAFTASRPEPGSKVVAALNRIDSSVQSVHVDIYSLRRGTLSNPAAAAVDQRSSANSKRSPISGSHNSKDDSLAAQRRDSATGPRVPPRP